MDWVVYFEMEEQRLKPEHIYLARIAQVLRTIVSMFSKNEQAPSLQECIYDLEKLMTPPSREDVAWMERTELEQKKAQWARWLFQKRKQK